MKTQVLHSPPSSDALQSARLVRLLWPDQQADGVLDNSRPTRADGQDKGGLRAVEERGGWAGRREADQGAAPHGTQALLLSWFQIHRLTTGVRVLI